MDPKLASSVQSVNASVIHGGWLFVGFIFVLLVSAAVYVWARNWFANKLRVR